MSVCRLAYWETVKFDVNMRRPQPYNGSGPDMMTLTRSLRNLLSNWLFTGFYSGLPILTNSLRSLFEVRLRILGAHMALRTALRSWQFLYTYELRGAEKFPVTH